MQSYKFIFQGQRHISVLLRYSFVSARKLTKIQYPPLIAHVIIIDGPLGLIG